MTLISIPILLGLALPFGRIKKCHRFVQMPYRARWKTATNATRDGNLGLVDASSDPPRRACFIDPPGVVRTSTRLLSRGATKARCRLPIFLTDFVYHHLTRLQYPANSRFTFRP